MGWYTLPKPGSKYGPCEKPCKHTDCAALRRDLEKPCKYCGKPIGYDKKMVFLEPGPDTPLAHWICYMEAPIEKEKEGE